MQWEGNENGNTVVWKKESIKLKLTANKITVLKCFRYVKRMFPLFCAIVKYVLVYFTTKDI